MSLYEATWHVIENNCDTLRSNIYELLAYIDDEGFKNDKGLKAAIEGVKLTEALEIIYDDVSAVYEKEKKAKKDK